MRAITVALFTIYVCRPPKLDSRFTEPTGHGFGSFWWSIGGLKTTVRSHYFTIVVTLELLISVYQL